ncbi:MAG TPA: hypothetical protein VM513_07720 [Kofleriaceae bacterium]|nr:hypothetical protein [Kofleriaceae bacterium]
MARTHFLNTDLDVVTLRDPTPLVAMLTALGVPAVDAPMARDDGHWFVNFEVINRGATVESTVVAILDAIEKLTGEAREIWYVANTRELHLGFEGGDEPRAFTEALTSETLARAAAAGMSLRFTLYAPART